MIKQIKLHPQQFDVWEDTHRFKVVCAGRKWGKSVLGLASALHVLGTKKNAIVAIISNTFQQAKDIYWRDVEKIPTLIPPEVIQKKNDSELFIQLKHTNSYLYLRGSDRPDTLRGLRFDFVVMDEFAKAKENVWDEIVYPNLLATHGRALFISTPYGYDKFFKLWEKGQGQDPEWKSWRFTSYDNPYIDKAVIEQARKDTDEDSFGQEYLAEFKKFSGLVYKDFDRTKHVIEPVEIQSNWTFYRAIDFGFINPTCVLFLAATDKGELIVYDEVYQSGLKTPDLAGLLSQKSTGRMITSTVADSAQASDIEELKRYGFGISPVSKTSGSREEDWTTYRIRKVSEKLRNGTLKITKNCTNLLFEFENYRYHEISIDRQIKEVPMKLNDHALDALSYLVVNLPERVEPVFEKQPSYIPSELEGKDWSLNEGPSTRRSPYEKDPFRIGDF